MDSPRHFFADGRTTSDVPLEATVGEAAVVDLTPLAPNEAITAGRLAGRLAHVYLATAEAIGATVATADRRFFDRCSLSIMQSRIRWLGDWPSAP